MNPSIAMYGRPGDESTRIVIVCRSDVRKVFLNSTARGLKDERQRLTRAMTRPSTRTTARPRVGPTGPVHATDEPVKVRVAVAPGVVDQVTPPPA